MTAKPARSGAEPEWRLIQSDPELPQNPTQLEPNCGRGRARLGRVWPPSLGESQWLPQRSLEFPRRWSCSCWSSHEPQIRRPANLRPGIEQRPGSGQDPTRGLGPALARNPGRELPAWGRKLLPEPRPQPRRRIGLRRPPAPPAVDLDPPPRARRSGNRGWHLQQCPDRNQTRVRGGSLGLGRGCRCSRRLRGLGLRGPRRRPGRNGDRAGRPRRRPPLRPS
jgi:hypothetical protein